MISSFGTSSFLGLKLSERLEPVAVETIRNSAQHARAITHFKENIGAIESVDQLLEDQELYGFVMRAFDLEDQIFGKALISKMLKSDINDPEALINRLTDSRFKDLYKALDFGPDGVGNTNTISTAWQNSIVEKYVTRQYINSQAEGNATVGIALEYREKIANVRNVFDILRDPDLSKVIRTAFSIPKETSGLDIDRQAAILREKIDIEELKTPEEIQRVMQRYATIEDALNGSAASSSPALQMLQSSNSFAPITINLEPLLALPARPYR